MARYRVMVNGRNFLVDLDGRAEKRGFITYRFIDAPDPASAESAAVQSIREDQSIRGLVLNAPDDPPVLDVTEITQLDETIEQELAVPGLIWYGANPKRWWQFWR